MRGDGDDNQASKVDSDIEALMDKYDSNEKKPEAPKAAAR